MPVGGTVTLTFTSTTAISSYWKLIAGVWTPLPSTVMANGLAVTFVDGGLGDADGTANGVIVDPGAPGQVAATPTTVAPPTTPPTVPATAGDVPQIPTTGADTLSPLWAACWMVALGMGITLLVRRRPVSR